LIKNNAITTKAKVVGSLQKGGDATNILSGITVYTRRWECVS